MSTNDQFEELFQRYLELCSRQWEEWEANVDYYGPTSPEVSWLNKQHNVEGDALFTEYGTTEREFVDWQYQEGYLG